MLNKLFCCAFLTVFCIQSVFADDIQVVGTIPLKLPLKPSKTQSLTLRNVPTIDIQLMKLSLSANALKNLSSRAIQVQNDAHLLVDNVSNLPRRVQLGMNRVPPLNQGGHGSCVTFAVTAAMDAILGKGDYISQLCQLELGTYLERNGFTSSGWDGSWGRIVLAQLDMFGFTPKTYQYSQGCAGLQEYPLLGDAPTVELTPPEFHAVSESVSKNQIAWSSILEVYQFSSESIDTNRLLLDIKQALNAGDRLTFGVLLLDFDQGVAGAVGTYHQPYDTWVLTPEIAKDVEEQKTEFAGHEMIITGYDDDAVAVDKQGRTYKGLLTLRNSWGSGVGDSGNFYITYDFFKSLTIEVQRIRQMS